MHHCKSALLMVVIHTSVIFCRLFQYFVLEMLNKRGICSVQPSVQHTTHTQAKQLTSANALYTYAYYFHSNLPWLTRHSIKFRQFLHIAAQLIHHTHHYVHKRLSHEWECRCNKSGPVLMQVSHVVLGEDKMQCWTWTVSPLPILASCLNKTIQTFLNLLNSKLMD